MAVTKTPTGRVVFRANWRGKIIPQVEYRVYGTTYGTPDPVTCGAEEYPVDEIRWKDITVQEIRSVRLVEGRWRNIIRFRKTFFGTIILQIRYSEFDIQSQERRFFFRDAETTDLWEIPECQFKMD